MRHSFVVLICFVQRSRRIFNISAYQVLPRTTVFAVYNRASACGVSASMYACSKTPREGCRRTGEGPIRPAARAPVFRVAPGANNQDRRIDFLRLFLSRFGASAYLACRLDL